MLRFKKVIMLVASVSLVLGSTVVVRADVGKCTHGGENPTLYVTSSTIVNCVDAGAHPVYVAGKLSTCHMYFYKYRKDYACTQCNQYVRSVDECGPTQHEYNHP